MSRHRNIRGIDPDEEYDQYTACYGHSVDDDFCISPNTEEQFLYKRNPRETVNSLFATSETVPEEDLTGEDNFKNFKDNSTDNLSSLDQAKLQSCVEAMQDIVGETIPESVLKEAAMACDFNLEKALNEVLQESAPKPRREPRTVAPVTPQPEPVYEREISMLKVPSQSKNTPKDNVKKDGLNDSRSSSPARKTKASAKKTASKISNEEEMYFSTPKLLSFGKERVASSTTTDDLKDSDEKKEEKTVKSTKSSKSGTEIYGIERADTKPLINLVVIGHVDAGKSTLMGHLLYRLGSVSQRNIHKFEKDSKKIGKGSFMYAWVLDETPEERNRGITMDVAFSSFETSNRAVTLLDAPGHKDFIPNMITGAAQADVAILVIDSTTGEFETGFEQGGQTREHTMLIRSLGVTEIAIAVNKMDNVGWSEERFNAIKSKMTTFLKQAGFKESDVTFVPCSGLSGENLVSSPQEESFKQWYSGPSLVEVIDGFHPPERPVDKPFRMCVSDTFKGATGGFCIAGKIEAGYVRGNDKVLAMPCGEQAVVKTVSVDDRSISYGFAGDHVILNITGVDSNNMAPGSMLCSVDKPVSATSRFEARLVIFNLPVPITKGFPVILHYQSLSEQATIKKLVSVLHRSSGEVVKNKPRCLTKNSSAIVEIEISRPICIELFKDFKDLGRFMLRSGGTTIAAGLVTALK